MKRPASIALVLALCSALALSGAVVAKEHPGNNGGQGGGPGAASLKVKGNASHPGGVFRVLAVLHAAKDHASRRRSTRSSTSRRVTSPSS